MNYKDIPDNIKMEIISGTRWLCDRIVYFIYHKLLLHPLPDYIRNGFVLLLVVILIVYIIPLIQEVPVRPSRNTHKNNVSSDSIAIAGKKRSTMSSIKQLNQKYAYYTPGDAYLVINTSQNKFQLYRYQKLVREGICSTGSYILLENGKEQKWIFKTPKGQFRIQAKIPSPVWKKPDWAFVEEGLPVPPPNHNSRFEYGVLGDYAMSLGYGYLIHGTLYKRFLGLPVTHGCIRLNDEDLEAVYKILNIGSKVFIY